jgi:CDGSH-type Zn-finger protein
MVEPMSEMPKICQKSPYVMELEPGRYSWCSCGVSAKQPFCDGSHRECEGEYRSVKFEITETKKVALCGCKHAKDGSPFCDGSHQAL